MNIEQEKMIVEALPSLYPLREHEEKAINAVIDALSTASAEPKRGKWICTGEPDESWGMMYECSICGNHDYGGNYCSYCGAKMEETNE